jgi:RNA-directed DNA polymerase
MSEAKPFVISKWEVWEAYKRVRANKGAAGVDEQSIADFEKRLKKNLYKIWNRMSSGSYFPPPVRTVKIPKANGGERKLGIPTVSDRIAQMVVKLKLEPLVDPLSSGFLWVSPQEVGAGSGGAGTPAMLVA